MFVAPPIASDPDAVGGEVTALALGERQHRGLVAEPLDEHDGTHRFRLARASTPARRVRLRHLIGQGGPP